MNIMKKILFFAFIMILLLLFALLYNRKLFVPFTDYAASRYYRQYNDCESNYYKTYNGPLLHLKDIDMDSICDDGKINKALNFRFLSLKYGNHSTKSYLKLIDIAALGCSDKVVQKIVNKAIIDNPDDIILRSYNLILCKENLDIKCAEKAYAIFSKKTDFKEKDFEIFENKLYLGAYFDMILIYLILEDKNIAINKIMALNDSCVPPQKKISFLNKKYVIENFDKLRIKYREILGWSIENTRKEKEEHEERDYRNKACGYIYQNLK